MTSDKLNLQRSLLSDCLVVIPSLLENLWPSYRYVIIAHQSAECFKEPMSERKKTLKLQHNVRACFLRDFGLREVLTAVCDEERAFLRWRGFAIESKPERERTLQSVGERSSAQLKLLRMSFIKPYVKTAAVTCTD